LIRAVFFDWYNTLAQYEPPREQLQSQALQEFGINASPRELERGLLIADRNYFEESARSPIRERSTEEQGMIYIQYQKTVLSEAGVNVPEELILKIMDRLQQLYGGLTFAIFDDVLSTLKELKEQNFTMGLLTNLPSGIDSICENLGVKPYLDFIVTSAEAGADKPNPAIFRLALERAGVNSNEAVHVGDQYHLDIIGARGVGINTILLDRFDFYPDVNDCPRIQSLTELAGYLQ
jgi:putative hydrolase of the HAD superfamily